MKCANASWFTKNVCLQDKQMVWYFSLTKLIKRSPLALYMQSLSHRSALCFENKVFMQKLWMNMAFHLQKSFQINPYNSIFYCRDLFYGNFHSGKNWKFFFLTEHKRLHNECYSNCYSDDIVLIGAGFILFYVHWHLDIKKERRLKSVCP